MSTTRSTTTRRGVDAAHRTRELDRLPPGLVHREAMLLGQVPDAAEHRLRPDGPSEDRAPCRRRTNHGEHDLHERALAGPVGTEEAEDLAPTGLHADAAQRVDLAAVALAYIVQIDREFLGSGRLRWRGFGLGRR